MKRRGNDNSLNRAASSLLFVSPPVPARTPKEDRRRRRSSKSLSAMASTRSPLDAADFVRGDVDVCLIPT